MVIIAKRKLLLGGIWKMHEDGVINIRGLAGKMADVIEEIEPLGMRKIDEFKDQIASRFRALSFKLDATSDDFDEILEILYGWADIKIEFKEVVCQIEFEGEWLNSDLNCEI